MKLPWFTELNENRFATICINALKKAGVESDLSYDADQFCLYIGDREQIWYLSNSYHAYRSASGSRRRKFILEHFINSVTESGTSSLPADFATAREHLLPGIREKSFFEPLRLKNKLENTRPLEIAKHSLANDFSVILQYDTPYNLSSLSTRHLENWGVSYEEALEIAIDNLRARSTETFRELRPGLYISPWQDDYDASRILVPEILYRLSLQGEPVVAIPNRNILLVTGSRDYDNLEYMSEFVIEQLQQDSNALSAITLKHDETTGWQVYPEDNSNPALGTLHNLHQRWRISLYSQQREQISALYQQYEVEISIPEILAFESRSSGLIHTSCTWTSKSRGLLPKTDFITFFSEPHTTPILVPWNKAWPVIAHRLSDTDFSPVRFSVNSFPDASELEVLRSLAIS